MNNNNCTETPLSCTKSGTEILKYNDKYQILQEEHRTLLISTITQYLDLNGCEVSLSDCAELEKQICIKFPTEELSFYTNGKRGKIYNKLANLKRSSKELFKEQKTSEEANFECEATENYAVLVQTLRSDKITAYDFDLYWRKCAPLRFKQIAEAKTTTEILNLWLEYTQPSDFQFINIDFILKYPSAKCLKDRWTQLEDSILNILKSKSGCSILLKDLQKVGSNNEESKTFTIFWHAHKLFPPQHTITTSPNGEKIRKRYSVADSQENFAVLATSNEELETKLKLLQLQGRNIQPRLLIIGYLYDIKTIYVYFDRLKFPFLTFLDAFDCLFKLFFVFNVEFPQESEVFYNFVQSV
ncbi:uncharacterized protein LOC111688897 [Lucilia cuprina]|uniref:uncharacterized protein LOC111688897 n=1 Tax=Lucilia cuprina TaxID=7375 RepID=UPI001F06E4BA|nr:uncharacterized protein LOC111688897 [Lucilia cuprina]XP_046801113.1 uncharacterized protein LOC111688897 [Lucilia cuprina]XP_046801114.1 uncharacterized protein LOC111688897 [Lucilia cuprina]XP_046801115.1 uncharacterized protein LOC111688897 [Lucilia cuprina]XP_046801116.1 uncharacterized protein LOC111688897 [Lucilia cuprina]XP_046801117.1 uncharacterized protein LOC111688897 [Lucilia cuprina]XP_046801118.1 uncharacterized protein LOC111688897 [Lucilia cuprina]